MNNLEWVIAKTVKQALVKTSKDMPDTEWPQRGLITGTPPDCLGIPRHRIGIPERRIGTPIWLQELPNDEWEYQTGELILLDNEWEYRCSDICLPFSPGTGKWNKIEHILYYAILLL